jgi:hypothetical protein
MNDQETKTGYFKEIFLIILILVLFVGIITTIGIIAYKKLTVSPADKDKKVEAPAESQAPSEKGKGQPQGYQGGPPPPDAAHLLKPEASLQPPADEQEVSSPEPPPPVPEPQAPAAEPIQEPGPVSTEPAPVEAAAAVEPPPQISSEPAPPEGTAGENYDVKAPEKTEAAPAEPSGKNAAMKQIEETSGKSKKKKKDKTPPAPPEPKMISVVHLKNGQQIEGNIQEEKGDLLIFENEGVTFEIKKEEVDNIEKISEAELQKRIDAANKVIDPGFMSGQEVIVVTYDDKIIQGSILKLDDEEIELLMNEGTFIIKRQNIKMIEKK